MHIEKDGGCYEKQTCESFCCIFRSGAAVKPACDAYFL